MWLKLYYTWGNDILFLYIFVKISTTFHEVDSVCFCITIPVSAIWMSKFDYLFILFWALKKYLQWQDTCQERTLSALSPHMSMYSECIIKSYFRGHLNNQHEVSLRNWCLFTTGHLKLGYRPLTDCLIGWYPLSRVSHVDRCGCKHI